MTWNRKGLLALVVGSLALITVVTVFLLTRPQPKPVDLTKVISAAQSGQVTDVYLSSDGQSARVVYENHQQDTVNLPSGESFTELLTGASIPVSKWPHIFQSSESGLGPGLSLLFRIGLIVGAFALMFFFMRRFLPGFGGNTQRKSGFEPVAPGKQLVTFDDVAGSDEVKEEVQDIVEFLREPERFQALGARIPRGLLLTGQPGTGKTLITKALAGEARAAFFSVSGSEFVELYVGVGASRVRDLFKRAKAQAPAIIFIDEIDAIGRRRGRMEQSSEYDQTLNQILVEMDGFEERTTVVVVAATNRADILDPALLRPGRFDRKVMVDLPDRQAREEILKVHARGKPIAADVSLGELAARTTGMSGADLSNVINEAAILAGRARRSVIRAADLFEALDRTLAGPARARRRFSERERQIVAYHEAGHAVVGYLLPEADTVHKVSIVARGPAGGYTMILPDEDRGLWTRNQLTDRLAALLGGLAAEEVIFGEITTGSSNDLEQTTTIASSMVQRFGMSKRFGLLSTGARHDPPQFSPQTAFTAEQEAMSLVEQAHEQAIAVLLSNRDDLERVAWRLLERETIEAAELATLIAKPRLESIPEHRANGDAPVERPQSLSAAHGSRRARRIGRALGAVAAITRGAVSPAKPSRPEPDRV